MVFFLLSGCAQTYWMKNGVTKQEFAKDTYDCEKDMRQSYFSNDISGAFAAGEFQSHCMVARGYKAVEK